jgi:aspartyl-tRNA synthetase
MELMDLGEVFASTEVKIFRSVLDDGGAVKGIVLAERGEMGRKDLDALVEEAKALGAGGLVWAGVSDEGLRSPLDKFFSDSERELLVQTMGARPGDLVLIVADKRHSVVHKVLGGLRTRLADRFGLVPDLDRSDPAAWKFAWIVDFPWFEWNDDTDRWEFSHHPFTGVVEDTFQYLDSDPGRVLSKAYDITLNGWELASGSIRIHDREIQQRVLEALGISREEAADKFGYLLTAFRYGVPPHGGIAPGIDRIVALAAGETNIREVIAFPKTQTAYDPLTGAPTPVSDEQLKALHLKVTASPKPASGTP